MAKAAKKADMVKIENHRNKKIRLGYLTSILILAAELTTPQCLLSILSFDFLVLKIKQFEHKKYETRSQMYCYAMNNTFR